ncbi:lipopolysaccharide kinase InaA family protein [Halopseudomonas salina]|uniref:Lipopolysaccharide kinase (Kdo/WaaP) family protein n=1 Tax=Halopseudomonas salina TaxID=1323744 RepID=A0ABQ1PPG7_9GAMM|nr:lipopolysaccharide kinase InaA family protein [Halopseudomonas salina]GGD00830.1 hypothetical protein GCM10007418_20100 [Halopseudomonas salina]
MTQSIIQTLRQSGREPPAPLTVATPSGELTVTDWLRVLPQQRLVGAGELAGQAVLVKLFIASRARQHWQREMDGLGALDTAQIHTPGIVALGELEHEGFYLCTHYLESAQTLQQQWDALCALTGKSVLAPGDPEAMALMGSALRSIALMHRAGLIQTDLHMGNFLLHEGQVHVIDGDAIKVLSPGQPISAREAEDNLAIFFAQLDSCWDTMMELLLIDYLQVNAERSLNPDRLLRQVREVRVKRLNAWLAKAVRDCTHFMVQKSWSRFTSVVRSKAEALQALLNDPDQPFAAAPTMKDGGSSSVTLAETQDGPVVIKRYNIKGLRHWLTRFWRPSRAWHSWLAGHRLQFLGIATPAPLAMIESRFGPLRRRAWLITEYCSGTDLLTHFGSAGERVPESDEATAILIVFKQLIESRVTHGDFKATNLLWDGKVLWLIDLDALSAHSSQQDWQRAWTKDRSRLIRNWPEDSPLRRWLEAHVPR